MYYTYTCKYSITIKEKRGQEFEGEEGAVYWKVQREKTKRESVENKL